MKFVRLILTTTYLSFGACNSGGDSDRAAANAPKDEHVDDDDSNGKSNKTNLEAASQKLETVIEPPTADSLGVVNLAIQNIDYGQIKQAAITYDGYVGKVEYIQVEICFGQGPQCSLILLKQSPHFLKDLPAGQVAIRGQACFKMQLNQEICSQPTLRQNFQIPSYDAKVKSLLEKRKLVEEEVNRLIDRDKQILANLEEALATCKDNKEETREALAERNKINGYIGLGGVGVGTVLKGVAKQQGGESGLGTAVAALPKVANLAVAINNLAHVSKLVSKPCIDNILAANEWEALKLNLQIKARELAEIDAQLGKVVQQ